MRNRASVRFDPAVQARLREFAETHPGLSLSSATNLLVDEALRMQKHPLIIFQDGPAGRRAKVAGGPDVWEVVAAVGSTQRAQPDLSRAGVISLVAETSGASERELKAALDYWSEFPEESDEWLERSAAEQRRFEEAWGSQQSNAEAR